jgi:radical SAM protein with 4Fe4S-binding SPASM domain
MRDFMLRRPRPAAGPFRLWVDITSRCNLRCPACAQRLLPPDQKKDMPDWILAKLADEAPGWVGEVNLFHRGEPLLHPRLPLWIKRFKKTGLLVRLHTNATRLGPEQVAGLLWSGPDFVTCSVDTLDPDAYARARPGASLEHTLAGVARLVRSRRRLGLQRPLVTLLTMGDKRPGPQARQTLKNLLGLGLDRVVHRRPHNWGGALGRVGMRPRPAVCTFPWYGLAVLSDGRIAPCPQDFFGQITLGTVDQQSLAEIWSGPAARALRQAHARRRLEGFPVCQSCDRIQRPTILGLPTEQLKNFLVESIVRAPRAFTGLK